LPSVYVQMLDVDLNRPFFQRFSSFWTPLLGVNDIVYVRPFGTWAGLIDREKFIRQKRVERKRFPCPVLYMLVVVDKDGFVYPCCLALPFGCESDLCLGNIMDKSIEQMFLRDDKIWDLRRLHKRGEFDKIDSCKNCDAWMDMDNIFFDFAGRWI